MEGTIVIKPLEETYEYVQLRTTTIEWSLHPHKFTQDDPLRWRTTTIEWNIFEECIMSSLMSREAWEKYCAASLLRIEEYSRMRDWSSKDLEFLKYKLENNYICDIADAYYKWVNDKWWVDIVSCQTAMSRFFECGKYLVEVSWTCDLMDEDGNIRDIKYYSSKWGSKWDKEYEYYDLDNYYDSIISNKSQWYFYPFLLWLSWEEVEFSYDVYLKSKNAPTEKKPDNHLRRQEIKCKVNMEKAEQKIKHDIIQYFKLCSIHWTKPWDKVSYS